MPAQPHGAATHPPKRGHFTFARYICFTGQPAIRSADQIRLGLVELMFPDHDPGRGIQFAMAYELAVHGLTVGMVG